STHNINRCAFLRAGFRQGQRSRWKDKAGKRQFVWFDASVLPVKTTRDHQMNDYVKVILEAEDNSFSQPAEISHLFSRSLGERRIDGTEHKGANDTNLLNRFMQDSGLERFDVG